MNFKSNLVILGITALVFTALAVAILLFQQPQQKTTVVGSDPTMVSAESAKAGTDLAMLDISDWQTYRNEEFGFEVRYPEDWSIEDTGSEYVQSQFSLKDNTREYSLYSGSITISVYRDINELDSYGATTLLDFMTIHPEIVAIQETKYNGYAAYEACHGGHSLSYILFLERSDGRIYEIFVPSVCKKEDFNITTQQILSTFRFMKESHTNL